MQFSALVAGAAGNFVVGLAAADCERPMVNLVPVMAPGYKAVLLASGLHLPSSVTVDPMGNVLVLEAGGGIKRVAIDHDDYTGASCVTNDENIIYLPALQHGLTISADSAMIFATSRDFVYGLGYNATAAFGDMSIISDDVVVDCMGDLDYDQGGTRSRSVLTSKFQPNWLLVSKGSSTNIDPAAADLSTGHSTIKFYPIDEISRHEADHPLEGGFLAAGLKSSVGMAEHPITGAIWSVDTSMNDVTRLGVDVHNDNPATELNFHGVFDPFHWDINHVPNYGYPNCVAAWDPSTLGNPYLLQGRSFVPNIALGVDPVQADATCAAFVDPFMVFPAHMEPVDITFHPDGMSAWIALYGSLDRNPVHGFAVARILFGPDGMPLNTPDRAAIILSNPPNAQCADDLHLGLCIRPSGLAFDKEGRLYMVSDSTGELWLIEGGQL